MVYRKISRDQDATALQRDLSRIHNRCKQWNMCLNAKKFIHICFTKKQKPLMHNYFITTVDVFKGTVYHLEKFF